MTTLSRESNSVYGIALDGLLSRGGIIEAEEFPVICGAPIALNKQVTVDKVVKRLQSNNLMFRITEENIDYYYINPGLGGHDLQKRRALVIAENVILAGLHRWVINMGLASFHKVAVRGDKAERMVGQFKWDLTGPSYLSPLKKSRIGHGFLMADVFCQGVFNENDIAYFIRKVELLSSSVKGIGEKSNIWTLNLLEISQYPRPEDKVNLDIDLNSLNNLENRNAR